MSTVLRNKTTGERRYQDKETFFCISFEINGICQFQISRLADGSNCNKEKDIDYFNHLLRSIYFQAIQFFVSPVQIIHDWLKSFDFGAIQAAQATHLLVYRK